MKKEEYINKVLLHIKNKAYLATIKNELEGHIADRESYYIEIGYDKEAACVKAMEHMGDADLLGEKMNRLHNDKGLKIASRTTAILGVAIFAIYAVFIDEYFNIGLSALCYAYAHNSAYLLVTVTFLVLMTVSY
ncbi:MAG: hypothetical protein J1E36_04220, partial [Eubacterium sp.]|nr:hypothetical protein [Eubacterium sp.]